MKRLISRIGEDGEPVHRLRVYAVVSRRGYTARAITFSDSLENFLAGVSDPMDYKISFIDCTGGKEKRTCLDGQGARVYVREMVERCINETA